MPSIGRYHAAYLYIDLSIEPHIYILKRTRDIFRYGAYLRAYYKEWKRRSSPYDDFWRWLDQDGVEVKEIPRVKLEQETVLYCKSSAERQRFALSIVHGVIVHRATGIPVETETDGWIFVLKDNILYAGKKQTESVPRVHHTSFVAGECVQAAGMMVIENGCLQTIYPHSGHYRPSDDELRLLLLYLKDHSVNLSNVFVDIQRVQKMHRESQNGKLMKKIHCAQFWSASDLLSFLNVKHTSWSSLLFDELVSQLERLQSL